MKIMDLLDPHKLYFSSLKDTHNTNSEKYFEKLVLDSKVDVEGNNKLNLEIKELESNVLKERKKENKMAFLKGFLIFLTVLSFIAFFVLIYVYVDLQENPGIYIPIAVGSLILGIVLIIVNVKVVNPKYKALKEKRITLEKNRDKLINEAYFKLSALNSMFDESIPIEIMNQTVPLINMDKYFDMDKYEYLYSKYGFKNKEDIHQSVVYVQSGAIEGNPFIIEKIKFQNMVNEVYHGYRTVSWTERVRGSDGKTRTVTRTQTLHATVTEPKPNYYYQTWLIYGNDAAESLNFTRKPSSASGKNEKQIDKLVEKGEKKLDNLVEKTLMDDIPGVYTKLGNVEFDVIFGAQDRDNEQEFRLLFTPLAQTSLLKILKDDKPYGDDFYFAKRKNMNFIHADHMEKAALDISPSNFEGYDLKAMKKFFVDYNNYYFASIYYTLAPLLCIPLYQQHKPVEYIYDRKYVSHVTSIEHEVMANTFPYSILKHEEASTQLILKTNLLRKNTDSDTVEINSYSYKAIPQRSYISVMASNGRVYQVPVDWYKYELVVTSRVMEVSRLDLTRKHFNSMKDEGKLNSFMETHTRDNGLVYKRGLLSFLLSSAISDEQLKDFKNIFTQEDNNE